MREECKLRVSENGVLRGIFGPKRNEVTGEWRKPQNVEFKDRTAHPVLFVSSNREERDG